jgi:hypothetical protein
MTRAPKSRRLGRCIENRISQSEKEKGTRESEIGSVSGRTRLVGRESGEKRPLAGQG